MSLNLHAQKGLDSSWQKASITFENGESIECYLHNFMKKTYEHIPTPNFTDVNEAGDSVTYRMHPIEYPLYVHKNDIRNIKIHEGEHVWQYDKLDLRKLNGNGIPIKSAENIFLLLFYKGNKANIYLNTFDLDSNIAYAPMYFLNYQDDFAVPYYKLNWNSNSSETTKNATHNARQNSLKWVTRDCPQMNEKIEKNYAGSYAKNENIGSGQAAMDEIIQFFDEYHQECK